MANPTSNFNWQMPTPTDLVTDLPADFEVFGQAVDSSMADLLGGTSGQILAKNSNTDMDFVWITNDVGDITEVAAGTGISGGGTSGAVTITNSMATAIDAKGDLIAGTGADTFARLAVSGTNGQVLSADSSAATGLAYVNPGGMTLLSTTTLSGASTVISSISQSYKNLYVIGYGFTNATATGAMTIKINNTTADYTNGYAGATNASPTFYNATSNIVTNSTQKDPYHLTGNQFFTLTINNYADSSVAHHPYTFLGTFDYAGGISVYHLTGTYFQFAGVSSLALSNAGGNWTAGTVKIYGVN
jgi:hypothetical protein